MTAKAFVIVIVSVSLSVVLGASQVGKRLAASKITDAQIMEHVSKDSSALMISIWACEQSNGMSFGFHRWLDASVNHWMPNPAPKGLTFARWERFLRDYAEKQTGRKCPA